LEMEAYGVPSSVAAVSRPVSINLSDWENGLATERQGQAIDEPVSNHATNDMPIEYVLRRVPVKTGDHQPALYSMRGIRQSKEAFAT
jgi:hypothetical protein